MSNIRSAPAASVSGNAMYAMFGKTFYLFSRLILPPLVLAHVTLAEYGLWSACFILIMYIGLTDVGFSSVYVRFSARYHAEDDTPSINRLLSTGIVTLMIMAVVVLFSLWMLLPVILNFLKVSASHQVMASILMMGTTTMFLLDLTLGAYCYLLHGLQRIREEQKVAVTGYVLELLFIAAFLQAGMGIYSLLAAFVLRYSWSLLFFMRLAHVYLPGLEIRIRHFDRNMLRHFFGYGLAIQASTLLGTALFSLDRVIAGLLFGPQGVAIFELAVKLPNAAISIPSAISNITLPVVSRLSALNDLQGIRKIYQQTSRSIGILAAIPLGFMAAFAAPIITSWLGNRDGLESLPLILVLTALWSHLHIITGPGSATFRAMGKVNNEFVYHALRIACLSVTISWSLLALGNTINALAFGLAGGSFVAALGYLIFNQRQMGLKLSQLIREVMVPSMLTYPIAYALYGLSQILTPAGLNRWESIFMLLMVGMLYVLMFAAVCWKWLLNEEEKERLNLIFSQLINKVLVWRKA